MKGCDEYSALIQLYFDQELNGPRLEDVRAHLRICKACQASLEAEARLSDLLRRSRPLYFAPDTLRGQVAQTAGVFHPPVKHPRALRETLMPDWMRPLLSGIERVHHWGALAASLVLVAATILLMPRIVRQISANSFIETAVAAHRGILDGSLPLEIQSESPGLITEWFAGRVPFTFRLPTSIEKSGHEEVYRLTGGRLVNYKGDHAALVAYQIQQQRISLLVSKATSAAAAGGEEVPSGGILFHYCNRSGFNVVTWSNHGLTYALVSSLPGSGRRSCLVCHQSLADGTHFSARRDVYKLPIDGSE